MTGFIDAAFEVTAFAIVLLILVCAVIGLGAVLNSSDLESAAGAYGSPAQVAPEPPRLVEGRKLDNVTGDGTRAAADLARPSPFPTRVSPELARESARRQHPTYQEPHRLVGVFDHGDSWTAVCSCDIVMRNLPSREACSGFILTHREIEASLNAFAPRDGQ